jgi:acetoacetyl-CoA reductase
MSSHPRQHTGRVALVTGGTRGIGAATAIALKNAGHKVVVNFIGNIERAEAFTVEHGIPSVQFDVADFAAVEAGLKRIVEAHGHIDILVNNAGISRDAPLHKMSYDMWESVIRTDLSSCFNLARGVIDGMRARGFGRIVNIGSINGEAGEFALTNYSAAKAGIHGFTMALAREGAAKGITVNTIAPGYVDTDLLSGISPEVMEKITARIPVGRLGRAEEVARAVVFLAAEEAGFITGSCLSINGGMHMH